MQPYFILDENAQYYECGFSCDNAIVVRVEDTRFFITDSRYSLEAKQIMQPYFILDENAQYYECGFSCDNAIVVRVEDTRFFITDSRYSLEAKQFCNKHTEVISSNDFIQSLLGVISKLSLKQIAFNPQELSVAMYEKIISSLKAQKCELVAKPNFHQQLRICKSEKEIALIATSQKFNKKAFKVFAKRIAKILKQSPSEKELHYQAKQILSHFGTYDLSFEPIVGINENGAKPHALPSSKCQSPSEKELHYQAKQILSHFGTYDLSFEPIVGINENGAKPHALPSSKCILKKNDILLFDAGIKYKRYCSDMTRTAAVCKDMHFGKEQKFKNFKKE